MNVREQLVEALDGHRYVKEHRCSCGWFDTAVPLSTTQPQHLADVLTPLVEQIATERAASELEAEAAYDDLAGDEQYPRRNFARRLRERADNLRFDAAVLRSQSHTDKGDQA